MKYWLRLNHFQIMSRKESERLHDIIDAIAKIESKISSKDNFFDDELLQAFALMNLQIIGEASNKLSPQTLNTNPQVPWRKVIGLGNLIVHEYFRVDLGIIWDVVEQDLPVLKQNIEKMLKER